VKTKKKEKFYFVFPPYSPCAGGFILLAKGVRDARKKAYEKGLFECDYIDLRAWLLRDGEDADYEFLKRFLEKDGLCYPPNCPKCEKMMLLSFKEAEEKMCKRCKEKFILEEKYFGGC